MIAPSARSRIYLSVWRNLVNQQRFVLSLRGKVPPGFMITLTVKTMKLLFRNRKRKSDRGRLSAGSENGSDFPDMCQQHREVFAAVRDATMTSAQRVAALCEAVDYVCRSGIEGDMVECGVWKGGSMMAVAKTLIQNCTTDRRLWLFDTFSGMSPPSEFDCDFRGVAAQTLLDQADRLDPGSVWCCSEMDEVRSRLLSTGYPCNQIRFVVGDVAQTLLEPVNQPARISLLRLDTDWYHSTRVELEQLFPLLSPGGVLIIDDYGHWKGCRKAVDEYFAAHQIRMFLHRIDYTGRMGIKQEPQAVEKNCDAA